MFGAAEKKLPVASQKQLEKKSVRKFPEGDPERRRLLARDVAELRAVAGDVGTDIVGPPLHHPSIEMRSVRSSPHVAFPGFRAKHAQGRVKKTSRSKPLACCVKELRSVDYRSLYSISLRASRAS
jgi:hypothetical protein